MKCTNCGAELLDGSSFCTNCGTPVTAEEPQVIPAEAAAEPAAQPMEQSAVDPTPAPESAPAKKGLDLSALKNLKNIDLKNLDMKQLAKPIAIAVAAIVVIVLLISLISGGGTSPIDGLVNLVNKGNFTMKINIAGEKMEFKVNLDVDKKEISAYGEIEDMEIGIYDGKLVMYNAEYEYGEVQDLGDQIEAVMEAFQYFEKGEWEKLLDALSDMDIAIADQIEDTLDKKEFSKGMDALMKKLEKKSWLQDVADYETESKDGVKTHIYKPDMYKFASGVLDCFEKAFEDADDFEDTKESLKDNRDDLKDIDFKLELGVKGKNLVEIYLKSDGEKYKISFTDIGDTKVDTERLEELIEEAE